MFSNSISNTPIIAITENQLVQLQHKAKTGLFEWDLQTNISVGSQQMYEILGYEKDDSFSDTERYWSMVHPDDLEGLKKNIQHAIAHENYFEAYYWITNAKGELKYIHSYGQIERDQNNVPTIMKGMLIDITEKKYYELSLEHANAELKNQLKELKIKEEYIQEKKNALKEAQSLAKLGSWEYNIVNNSMTWSDEMFRLLGYKPQSLQPSLELWMAHFTSEAYDDFVNSYIKYDPSQQSNLLVHSFTQNNKSVRSLQSRWKVQTDAEGIPIKLQGTTQDITEQVEIERKLLKRTQELNFLAENALDLISLHDKDGKIIYASPSWKTFSGISSEEMINISPEEIMHPDDVHLVAKIMSNVFLSDETLRHVARIKCKDGSYKWLEGSVKRFYNNDLREWEILSSARNIHDRKIAEMKLEEHKNELLEMNREMEAFSYSVSHDLRSPLRAIQGFSKILEEEYVSKLDDEGKRLIQIIVNNSDYMNSLIENLLDFARIYKRDIKKSNYEIADTIDALWEKRIQCEDHRNHQLIKNNLINAPSDLGLMEIVWGNLICNAVKFTSKTVQPKIIIDAVELPDAIQYSVIDNGVGFEKKYQHKLFGIFQKLHSKTEYEGNGVGLAIVKRIIVKHGGKVWAVSTIGEGTTFYFTLPKI